MTSPPRSARPHGAPPTAGAVALAPVVPEAAAVTDPLWVPARLPARRYGRRHQLETLSPASLRAFLQCPELFRRRYLLGEKTPASFQMALGSVVGDAMAHYFQAKMAGAPPPPAELDDLVLVLYEAKIEAARLGPEDDPAVGRERCRAAVADYLTELAPGLEPISVERRASFRLRPEQEWRFVCYFDLELAEELADLKFSAWPVSPQRAARDIQATAQTYMRWAEERPARFAFYSGLHERPEQGPRWSVVPAPRSEAQLRAFERRVAAVARLIDHLDRTEPGPWPLSSDLGWWCAPSAQGEGCPYWERCPVGGR
jgi:hypothetical protein